jgi:subtilisin family serine protease
MRVFSVFLLVLFASSASARHGSAKKGLESVDGAIPDEYIVILDEGVESRGPVNSLKNRLVNDLKNRAQAEIIHDYTIINGFAVRMNLKALQKALKTIGGGEIYPNDIATASITQSPVRSWGLDRVDQTIGGLDNLDGAYTYLRDGDNVDVYVIDTGIFKDHEDFGGRASFGPDYTGEGNGDRNGHGTHVAGTSHWILSFSSFLSSTSPTMRSLVVCKVL